MLFHYLLMPPCLLAPSLLRSSFHHVLWLDPSLLHTHTHTPASVIVSLQLLYSQCFPVCTS
ncbi:hypothetical protein BD311DRAFT_126855 [Dichomitus squalens]|uniref:Uncharacterized protein n=1 Tax=Dichomitus squalens TaxID=114155 RepID=A0A4Q9M6W1_9APHY|nr:hypothetical protein BD311DRAFT_126855 [Dichomitus squalens]